MELTNPQIASAYMHEIGGDIGNLYIADVNYKFPTLKFIQGAFSKSLRDYVDQFSALGIDIWRKEINDCDNRALQSQAWFHALYNADNPAVCSVAFGMFWYYPDAGGGHAINVAMVRAQGGLVPVFYEPQTFSVVSLSTKEKRSCRLAVFC